MPPFQEAEQGLLVLGLLYIAFLYLGLVRGKKIFTLVGAVMSIYFLTVIGTPFGFLTFTPLAVYLLLVTFGFMGGDW